MVIWITGISGSGKTTLGKKIFKSLKKKYLSSIFFDGDKFRKIFDNDLKYTLKDRDKNAHRLTRLIKALSDQKINVVVAANLTSHKYRTWCRKNIKNYFEIYIEVKKNNLLKRDYKNLYCRVIKKKIKNVVGIDLPFKKPTGSHLYLKNNKTKKDFLKNVDMIFYKINISKIKIF